MISGELVIGMLFLGRQKVNSNENNQNQLESIDLIEMKGNLVKSNEVIQVKSSGPREPN